MKITMLGHKRFPSREGGIEVVVSELAVRMARLGHTVICLNRHGHHVAGKEYDPERRYGSDGVWIHDVWTLDRAGLAAMTASVSGAIRAALSRTEVVHFHAEGPCAMLWLPKLFGKRCIATIHGLDHQRAKWGAFARWYIMFGERMAARHADEIIVLSRPVQEYFRKTYGRETRFIPNGVSVPDRPFSDGEIARAWGLGPRSYILFVARMVPEKGIRRLIEAFREVRTDKRLVLVGGPSGSEAFYKEMQELAAGDPRILFTGFVQGEPLRELFGNAYLFVLPSDLEGMPLALLEAMACGNACLVSDIPECTDVAGDAALVFDRNVPGDLRDKLQAACDRPETLEPLRAAAVGRVRRRYDWDDVVRRTLDAYAGKPDTPPAES